MGKSFGISENVGEKFEIPRHLFTPEVRNHFVPNSTNSKFIRLKKISKNIFLLQQNIENARTNEKFFWFSAENFNLTAASQLVC